MLLPFSILGRERDASTRHIIGNDTMKIIINAFLQSNHRKKLRVFLIFIFTIPCLLITRSGFVMSEGGPAFVKRVTTRKQYIPSIIYYQNAPSLYYLFEIPSFHAFAYDTELDPSGTVTFVAALFFVR